MLAFAFFAAIFSSLCWLIYALAYVSDNIVGISFSSLGIVDISVYTAFVVFPVFLLWMVFGYINQHINNQRTAKALYQLFAQMKKNQDYTDLVARIMLESEQQIKDGFILSRIDILISDMNELIAEIINRAALASREQIESLWSRVRNGGKWALGKVIIEINQNQPNFQMRLYDKAQNDTVLAGSILEFCARYQNILALLGKHDAERVFLSVIETGVFGKVFTILAPLADEIRKFRENAYYNKPETDIAFNKPKTEPKTTAQPQKQAYAPQERNAALDIKTEEEHKPSLIDMGLSKLGAFLKKIKNLMNLPVLKEKTRSPLLWKEVLAHQLMKANLLIKKLLISKFLRPECLLKRKTMMRLSQILSSLPLKMKTLKILSLPHLMKMCQVLKILNWTLCPNLCPCLLQILKKP